MISDVTKSGVLASASKPKPVLNNLPRPTSDVPTLSSLLNDNTSPYKPSIGPASYPIFQCEEDPSMVFPRANRSSMLNGRESIDMDISLHGICSIPGIHILFLLFFLSLLTLLLEDDMNESNDSRSAYTILASLNKSPKQQQHQQEEEDEENENEDGSNPLYQSFVDNYVVNYDSDLSMTLNMKSLKVPGFNNLYDEEQDMSMTNICLQPPSNAHDTSNSSELDMSMTHNFKTNPADITNYNYADMSIASHKHNSSTTSINESMDMSVAKIDIGKFAALDTSANSSVDMSVTNIRIPTPSEEEEEEEGINGDRFGGYNNTLNNFAVTYDDNVSMTMRMSNIKYTTEEEEEIEEEEPASDAASDKYNTSVDNFVMNYDDDIVDTNTKSADQSMNSDVSMEMTMTKSDFGKLLAKEQEEENAGEEDMNTSMQNISLRKEDLMNESDLSIGSPAPAIIGKIITPRRSATKRKSTTPTSERRSKIQRSPAVKAQPSPAKGQKSPAVTQKSPAAKLQSSAVSLQSSTIKLQSSAIKLQQSPAVTAKVTQSPGSMLRSAKKRLSALAAPSPAAAASLSFSASPFASPSFAKPVRGLPASHQLSPSIPDFSPSSAPLPPTSTSASEEIVESVADMSAGTMDELLSMSMRKIESPSDKDDSFSFARFLQLANIPFFNSSRCSIAP